MAPKAAAAKAAEAERKAKEEAGMGRGGRRSSGGNLGGLSRLMSRSSNPGASTTPPPERHTEVRDPWGKVEKKGEKTGAKQGEKKAGGGMLASGEGGDSTGTPPVYAYSCMDPDGTISYQYHSCSTSDDVKPLPFSANVQEAEWQTMIGNAFMALGKLHKAMDCFLEGGLYIKRVLSSV
jgi:hypothetical protein